MEANFSSAAGSSGTTGLSEETTDTTGQQAAGTSGGASQQTGSALREELANLKSDLDALLGKASSLTDRELGVARDRLMTKFGSMRYAARDMASDAKQQLNQGMEMTTEYVKDKPLQSVAIATGVGLLVGAMLRRH